ncbi:hypothetical protein DFH09DRAFT_1393210 [Mycena vulgaris]|nr:hypothetical protein DFH09DRAFT_1393210 [Mycena vulgaris]
MKLYAAGVSGPLFDWLRMLYARMSYVVRQGSELTDAFKSLIGVDTASPILWNIYFADLADVFGPDQDDVCLDGRPISHLEQADDVTLFSTTAEASKARAVANTTFASKTMIGCLPPFEGIRMYMARSDPHLTFGCEVCLDVVVAHLKELSDVQHEFIRRLLGVNSRSVLAILHTETGVIPLPYRRAILALGYLIYLITLLQRHFAKIAYLDSEHLANASYPGPCQSHLPMGELDADSVIEIREGVTAACERWLGDLTLKFASRLPLIQGRLERDEDGKSVQMPLKMRQYHCVPGGPRLSQ